MFGFRLLRRPNSSVVLRALGRSVGLIEFTPDGIILSANDMFCKAMGYDEAELKGQHHGMFVDPDHRRSPEYKMLWEKLRRGEYDAGEFRRFAKGGREVWIQASYNPVKNARGAVMKVVKQATDITAEKLKAAETTGIVNAILRAQAVIEFTPDGTIITANENFLNAVGYRLTEIQGQKHRMFVDPAYAQSKEYDDFWKKLRAGEYVTGDFERVGKGGKAVWLQASYNPVFDPNGKIIKIIKFATEVSGRVRAVTELGAGLVALSGGNMQYRINKTFSLEFEPLRVDFNAAMETLQTTMKSIAMNAHAVRAGAGEITQASDDLSRRTEHQAASLEQTAAALDQVTATVRRTAENANAARNTVAEAKSDAERSSEVVGETVAAMTGIENASKQIGSIIGVIDEIAFQTNLLALNAGVEAARAGDAGRGFAVVATEVRALAQRSADAAKEIKTLISSSSTQVDAGVKLVGETGKALSRIVEKVVKLNGLVTGIASSAHEQAIGLNEVNTAVNQMDQVTQQNAAMVEEATAASHSLAGEAQELTRLVGQFKIGQDAEHHALPPPVRKAASVARPSHARTAPRTQGGKIASFAKNSAAVAMAATADDWDEF